jgi:hypothetical protein
MHLFGSSWFYGVWNEEWFNYNITVKEFYPVILAVDLWGEKMASKAICLLYLFFSPGIWTALKIMLYFKDKNISCLNNFKKCV